MPLRNMFDSFIVMLSSGSYDNIFLALGNLRLLSSVLQMQSAVESPKAREFIMKNPVNSILINAADDVATTLSELGKGDVGCYILQGKIQEVTLTSTVPKYHKFAVRNIRHSEAVHKYGEVIGTALEDIGKGSHVHVHNLTSPGRDRE